MALLALQDLPRLPSVRKCDYRQIVAPSVVEALPEEQVEAWRQALAGKARLIILGTSSLENITTDLLFAIRPRLSAECLREERRAILSDHNMITWISWYRHRKNPLSKRLTGIVLRSNEDTRSLFLAFVGAVMAQRGYLETREWLGALFAPELNRIQAENDTPSQASTPTMASDDEDEDENDM